MQQPFARSVERVGNRSDFQIRSVTGPRQTVRAETTDDARFENLARKPRARTAAVAPVVLGTTRPASRQRYLRPRSLPRAWPGEGPAPCETIRRCTPGKRSESARQFGTDSRRGSFTASIMCAAVPDQCGGPARSRTAFRFLSIVVMRSHEGIE